MSDPRKLDVVPATEPARGEPAGTRRGDRDDWHVCATWIGSDARLNSKTPVVSDVPSLVMQGEFDPTTPKLAKAGCAALSAAIVEQRRPRVSLRGA